MAEMIWLVSVNYRENDDGGGGFGGNIEMLEVVWVWIHR